MKKNTEKRQVQCGLVDPVPFSVTDICRTDIVVDGDYIYNYQVLIMDISLPERAAARPWCLPGADN